MCMRLVCIQSCVHIGIVILESGNAVTLLFSLSSRLAV